MEYYYHSAILEFLLPKFATKYFEPMDAFKIIINTISNLRPYIQYAFCVLRNLDAHGRILRVFTLVLQKTCASVLYYERSYRSER